MKTENQNLFHAMAKYFSGVVTNTYGKLGLENAVF